MQRSDPAVETRGRWCRALLLTALFTAPAAASAQAPSQPPPPAVQIVSSAGWPELRVDGKPFFVHAASFDYFRIPPDLWAHCLDSYHDLGINTIDLRIPWNWQEPAQGSYDFSGATNPRRDLRGLLHLIADRGFKLIVRAGPGIGDEWRSDGIPDWLLADSQSGMTASQIADGDEPPLEKEFRENAESAAAAWLASGRELGAAREWFAALGGELAPYDSRRRRVVMRAVDAEQPKEESSSGPLLFFILEDRPSLLADVDSAQLQKYFALLRDVLSAAGVAAPILVEPADLEVSGASPLSAWLADSTEEHVVGVSGSWSPIWQRQKYGQRSEEQEPGRQDAESIAMLLGTLSEQTSMPPVVTNFQVNSAGAWENDSAVRTAPSSVLLGSRLLLAGGARGIAYSPLQDSITPAGYEIPGSSRYVNRDSPLDIEGEAHPGAVEVGRNGRLVAGWGEWLAGAHVQADFGIVDLRATAADPDWKVSRERATKILKQMIRTAESADRSAELVNPALQSVDRLLGDPVLLLAVPDGDGESLALSGAAQKTLIEYVERGGTLICAPRLPSGSGLAQLWNAPGTPLASPNGRVETRHAYGRGAVIEWDQDFFSLATQQDSAEVPGSQNAAAQAARDLAAVLGDAGAEAIEKPSSDLNATPPTSALLFSELVADIPAKGSLTPAESCNTRPLCAAALVSLTNLDPRDPAEADLSVLAPALYPQTQVGGRVVLHATIPAHDSMLLPIRASLCTAANTPGGCQDEIVYAGAELLGAEADGKTLDLTFYAPVNATVLLRLESQPEKIELDENELEGSWADGIRLLTVTLLRGAAPDYLRVLKIHLHYLPHVAEKPSAPKHRRSIPEASVVNAVRLPLGRGASMTTSPALLLLQNEKENTVVLRAINRGDATEVLSARVDGPMRGTDELHVGAGATDLGRIKLETPPTGGAGRQDTPAGNAGPAVENHALVRGVLTLQSGGEHSVIPLAFADLRSGGPLHYEYDFERDGAPEWTLESDALRLIFCPRDGGRAVAIVSKFSGEDLTTVTGALRDWFLVSGANQPQDFTFNRPYEAEWAGSGDKPGLRMKYHAVEAGPSGATIEKTITLVSADAFEANYRVALDPAPGAPPDTGMQFIAADRVPARQSETDGTKVCWSHAAGSSAAESANQSGETCVDFQFDGVAGGDGGGLARTLPSGTTHLEIQTPGSAGLRMEWTAGEMSLQMESGAILLQLALPLGPDSPAETVVRYTVFLAP